MELNNEFRVGVPPAVAWSVLTDVERIAPCLPGAQLQEVEGDQYRGIVKVKVGPITAQYKGAATFLERDEAAGRVVLRAEGRDTRGQGNANATITATLVADGDGTVVTVVTELTVTGKVAQFGRGVMAEVSGKLLNQFVTSLERDVLAAGSSAPAGEAVEPAEPATQAEPAEPATTAKPATTAPAEPPARAKPARPAKPTSAAPIEPAESADPPRAAARAKPASHAKPPAAGAEPPAPAAAAEPPEPTVVRKIDSPEPRPVDLLDAAGGSVAKRSLPLLAGLGVLLLAVLAWRRRRRR